MTPEIRDNLINQHRTTTRLLEDLIHQLGSPNLTTQRVAEIKKTILYGLANKQHDIEIFINNICELSTPSK